MVASRRQWDWPRYRLGARRSGTVLFVSSIAGRIPLPFLMPYSMSKFALSAAGAGCARNSISWAAMCRWR